MKICLVCHQPFVGHFNRKICGPECNRRFKLEYNRSYYREKLKAQPKANVIPPFPEDIEREGFAYWLSGFADGEATFGLRICRQQNKLNCLALFRITLRDDDADTLRMIHSFWQCGRLTLSDNSRSKIKNAKPIAIYGVQSVADLTNIVIPHFERYPLRAKKRNDFLIWRKGVDLMAEIQSRPRVYREGGSGFIPVWSSAEREQFRSISAELVKQREYAM